MGSGKRVCEWLGWLKWIKLVLVRTSGRLSEILGERLTKRFGEREVR